MDEMDSTNNEETQAEVEAESTEVENTEVETEDDHDDGDQRPNREARYRRALREAEAERDALQGRLEVAQRGLAEHLAETVGRIRPEALWASGVSLDDLMDEGGTISPDRVREACEKAASHLGLTRRPLPDPSQGKTWERQAQPFVDAFSASRH